MKFFQSTGKDWQPQMSRVLSVWVHERLAGMIDGAETMASPGSAETERREKRELPIAQLQETAQER